MQEAQDPALLSDLDPTSQVKSSQATAKDPTRHNEDANYSLLPVDLLQQVKTWTSVTSAAQARAAPQTFYLAFIGIHCAPGTLSTADKFSWLKRTCKLCIPTIQ